MQTMQNHAGVFRNGKLLQEGIEKLDAIAKDFDDVKVSIYIIEMLHKIIQAS